MNYIKTVFIGDKGVGKTSFIRTISTGYFPHDCQLNDIDNYTFEANSCNLTLHDTSGEDSHDLFRPLIYKSAGLFVVCYAVNDRTSYDRVTQKWLPEIQKTKPMTPIILVGLKSDTITSTETKSAEFVMPTAGDIIASENKLNGHYLCSAIKLQGISQIIDKITELASSVSVHTQDNSEPSNPLRDFQKRLNLLQKQQQTNPSC